MNKAGFGPALTVLNDTDAGASHFGCHRVMNNIRTLCLRHDLDLVATVPSATPLSSPAMRRAIRRADMVLVNGEGTLHHGRRRASWLIDAMAYAKSRGKPVALINALYQDNPDSWNAVLRQADVIQARDSRSAAALSAATGRAVDCAGDLALFDTHKRPLPGRRAGIVFGDSVHIKTTRRLFSVARHVARLAPARVVPVTRYRRAVQPGNWLPFNFQTLYAYYCHRKAPKYARMVSFAGSPQAYMKSLERSALSVTGRFHAVCFALLTRTPFVAVASNSWKMEAMIDDAGLDPARLVTPHQLSRETVLDHDWAYSELELAAIDRYLANTRTSLDHLFCSLHGLVDSAAARAA